MPERDDGRQFCQRMAFHTGNTCRVEVTGSEDESTEKIDHYIQKVYGLWHL